MPTHILCPRCSAIYVVFPVRVGGPFCKACNLQLQPQATAKRTDTFFDDWELTKCISDIRAEAVEHDVEGWLRHSNYFDPIQKLFHLLAYAESYIHLLTWGMSFEMLGALKLLAAREVVIEGVIAGAHPKLVENIVGFEMESILMNLKTIDPAESNTAPHVKLLVIDGIVAIKGSANLTLHAWRKAKDDLELIEIVGEPREVARLNNQYFSPIWKRYGSSVFFPGIREEDVYPMTDF